jgi:hypothetical protein
MADYCFRDCEISEKFTPAELKARVGTAAQTSIDLLFFSEENGL